MQTETKSPHSTSDLEALGEGFLHAIYSVIGERKESDGRVIVAALSGVSAAVVVSVIKANPTLNSHWLRERFVEAFNDAFADMLDSESARPK